MLSLRKLPFADSVDELVESIRKQEEQERQTEEPAAASRVSTVPRLESPQQLWQRCQATLPDPGLTIQSDRIVVSDSDPSIKLRRIEAKFYSQELEGKKWGHPCVIFMPADPGIYQAPERRGKVVVVGQRSWDGLATGPWRKPFLGNYGEPIAALTRYPTMICPVPGEYDDAPGREISIGFLRQYREKTQDPTSHNYFRLAIPYLRALDVMAQVLDVERDEIQAIIGGHSKRATSAYTAAAIDPELHSRSGLYGQRIHVEQYTDLPVAGDIPDPYEGLGPGEGLVHRGYQ